MPLNKTGMDMLEEYDQLSIATLNEVQHAKV